MSTAQQLVATPISLPELIALNEEIAALVRVGIPLEVGLGSSRGTSKRLRAITERLRLEMQNGASLPDALRKCGAEFPPSYLALVEAGLRSNRLSDALVSASAFTRTLLEMQDQIRNALVYPLVVVSVAYVFLIFFLRDLLPRLAAVLQQAHAAPGVFLQALTWLSKTLYFWAPVLPVIMILIAMWLGILSSPFARRPSLIIGRLRWIPGIRKIFHDLQGTSFCQMLAILVERQIPLADALELASSTSSNKALIRDCRESAAALRAGVPLGQALRISHRLPAFTRWMLIAAEREGKIPSSMLRLSDVYRRRARSRARFFQMAAPLVLTVVIGGGTVAAYACLLFIPMQSLLLDLSAVSAP